MPRVKKREILQTKTTTRRKDTRPEAGVPGPVNATNTMAMIAEAAYFIAEKRQFTPGYELDDWLAAEQQIEAELRRYGTSSASP